MSDMTAGGVETGDMTYAALAHSKSAAGVVERGHGTVADGVEGDSRAMEAKLGARDHQATSLEPRGVRGQSDVELGMIVVGTAIPGLICPRCQ